jgi:tape measure domain-containing protein
MFEVAQLSASLGLDASQYNQGLDAAEGKAKSFGASFTASLQRIGETALGVSLASIPTSLMQMPKQMATMAFEAIASYEKLTLSLESLAAKEIRAADTTVSLEQAMTLAKTQVIDTVKWVEALAVKSPFTAEGVAQAFRMAQAYGFTATEAKRLNQAMIDFASGTGAGESSMQRIAMVLGQIKAAGRLLGQDMMQLTSVGLPLVQILADHFKVTTAEIVKMREQGLIPAKDAIEAITVYMETNFAGAAERQATSWAGLVSTISDLKAIGLREIFTPAFQEVQPYVQKFVDLLSSEAFHSKLRDIGKVIGQDIAGAIAGAQAAFQVLGQIWTSIMAAMQAAIGPFINTVISGFQTLLASIGPIISGIGQAIGQIFGITLTPAAQKQAATAQKQATTAAVAGAKTVAAAQVAGAKTVAATQVAGVKQVGGAWDAVNKANEESGKKIIDNIASFVDKAQAAAKSLLNMGGGIEDITKPGANGPFEKLYQALDVAKLGGDSPYAKALGLTKEDAIRISKDFQSGLFTEEVKKLIDMPMLASAVQLQATAEKSKQLFIAEVAKIAGVAPTVVQTFLNGGTTSGGGLTPETTAVVTKQAAAIGKALVEDSQWRDVGKGLIGKVAEGAGGDPAQNPLTLAVKDVIVGAFNTAKLRFDELVTAFSTGGLTAVGQKLIDQYSQAFADLLAYIQTNVPIWAAQVKAKLLDVLFGPEVFTVADSAEGGGPSRSGGLVAAVEKQITALLTYIQTNAPIWAGQVKAKLLDILFGPEVMTVADSAEGGAPTRSGGLVAAVEKQIAALLAYIQINAPIWAGQVKAKLLDILFGPEVMTVADSAEGGAPTRSGGLVAAVDAQIAALLTYIQTNVPIWAAQVKDQLGQLWAGLPDGVQAVIGALAGLAALIGAASIVQVVLAIASSFATLLLAINPVTLAIGALILAFMGLGAYFATQPAQFQELITILTSIFGPTIERIQLAIGTLGAQFETLKPKLTELGVAFGELVKALEPIGVVVAAVIAIIVKLIGEVLGQVIANAGVIFGGLLDVVTNVMGGITDIITIAVAVISGIFSGDWEKANTALKASYTSLDEHILGIVKGIVTAIEGLVKSIWDAISNLINDLTGTNLPKWDEFKEGVVKAFEQLATGVNDKVSKVRKAIDNIVDAIQNAISNPTQLLYNVGRDIIAGLAQGIIDMKDHLLKRAQELFDGLPVWARKLLGIASPSKVFEVIGQEAMAGFAIGLTAGAVPVLGSITNTIQAIIAAFAELAGWAASPNSGFASAKAVLEPLNDMLTALQGVLEGLDALADFVPRTNIAAKLPTLFESIKTIVRGFADMSGWAADPAHGFWGAKAVLKPLSEMLEGLPSILDTVAAIAAYDTKLAKTQAGVAYVVEAIQVIIGKLAELNRKLVPAELTDALDLARVLGQLAEGLAAVPTLLEVINGALNLSERLLSGFVLPNVAQLRRVGEFIAQLVTEVGKAAALADEELRAAAVQLANSVGPVLAIIGDALGVLADMRSYIIVPNLNILRWQVFQISFFIMFLVDSLGALGRDIHDLVYSGAQKLLEVTGPALAAVKMAFELLDSVRDFLVIPDMNLLRWQVFQITWFIKYLVDNLGVFGKDMSDLVLGGARRFEEVALPALAAVKMALDLLADVREFVAIPDMKVLSWQVFQITAFIKYLVDSLGVFGKDISSLVYAGAQLLIEVAGPALALVKTALEAIAAVRDYVPVPSLNAVDVSLQQLATFIKRVVNLLGAASALITDELMTAAQKLATAAGPALGLIKTGIDALTAIKDYVLLPTLNSVDKSLQQLVTFIQRVVNLLGTATPLITGKLLEAAQKLATAAGPALGLIKTGIDALVAIKDYVLLPSLNAVDESLKQLVTFIQRVVNLLGTATPLITDVLITAAQKLATAAGPALGLIKTGIDALTAIKDYVLLPSLNAVDESLKQLVTFIQRVVNLLGTATPLITDALMTAAQKLATAAGPALGLIKTGIDALVSIKDYVLLPSLDAVDEKLQQLAEFVQRVVNSLGVTAALISDKMLEAAQKLATGAGPVLGIVKSAVDALTAIKDYVSPAALAFDTFMTDMGQLIIRLSTWAAGNLTEALVKAAQNFGAATATLFSGLGGAFTTLTSVQEYVGPTEDALNRFMADVFALVNKIAIWAAGNLTEESAKAAGLFGDATGGLFGGLADAVSVFKDLQSYIPVLNSRIQGFLDSVTYAYGLIEDYASHAGVQAATAATTAFATAAGGVFGMLGTALGVVKQLTDGAASSALTFKIRMADLIERIAGTLSAWRAYVAKENLVSWLPTATEFGTALEQVFGVLERALNLFTALGEHGLPSMAQFQDFIDYVAKIMQSIAGGLGGGGDAESLGAGLGSAIGHGMALGLAGATAEVQAAARQLALAVEPGLLGGSYTVTSERRIVVEFTGQAGGGVPLNPAQFELLKNELAYAIRIGA